MEVTKFYTHPNSFSPKDAWDNLSIKEKAEMMKVAIRNGITNLGDIKAKYNEFAEGGDKETPKPVTTGGAGYVPPAVDASWVANKLRNRLYRTINPLTDYNIRKNLAEVVSGNTMDYGDIHKDKEGNAYVDFEDATAPVEIVDDIWAKYLSIPKNQRRFTTRIEKSAYRPQMGGNENLSYYRLPLTDYEKDKLIEETDNLPIGKNKVTDLFSGYNLADHTIGRGIDERGEYRSYYDRWDINPFSGKYQGWNIPFLRNLSDTTMGIGKPVEIYDRIYLDDYYGVSEPTHATYLPEVTEFSSKHKTPFEEMMEEMGRKAEGGNLFRRGGYRPSTSVKKRISTWEGTAMAGAKDPLSGKWGKNRSFEAEADSFYNALPSNIRNQVLSNPDLADNLFSYSYNVGAGNFKKRVVPALIKYYNGKGSAEEIANSMWASGDKKLRGLRKRRAVERQGVVDALSPAFMPQVADNTFMLNPYITQVENTQMLPIMVPDEDSYVTTHEVSPAEQKAIKFNAETEAMADYNRLMNTISILNNSQPEYTPANSIYTMKGLGGPIVEAAMNEYKNGGKIRIKPENRGKFTALKERTGHSATWFKQHGTPAQKKMATFALNARKWKHGLGGNLFLTGGPEERGREKITNLSVWDELAAQSPLLYTIGKAVDPTGISGYGDAREAINQYDNAPSLNNGYTAVMETLGALPIVSKAGKAIKFLQEAITGQGIFNDYNHAQEKMKEYGDELVVDYWDNTIKPRWEAERHGEQMKSKMSYTDVHHVPSFKLAPKGSKPGQIISDYNINHRIVKKYKKELGGNLFDGTSEDSQQMNIAMPDATYVAKTPIFSPISKKEYDWEDAALHRTNQVYSNYNEAKDEPLSLGNTLFRNSLRWIKDNIYEDFPSGISNCTLSATQWVDPQTPVKGAKSIYTNPERFNYTAIDSADIVPGNLIISKVPNKDSYHTMMVTGFAGQDSTANFRGKNYPVKKGEPLMTYSRGGHDNSFIQRNVPLSIYTANSDGHTQNLFYRYNYPREVFLPEIVITPNKKKK